MTDDEHWMRLALDQAHQAAAAGEVPVGAVLVKDGVVIGRGRNTPRASHDPSAHAEINALRAGAAALANYRLDGCELFVTLEPCAMCAGAMLHARLARVVYGARDPKTGAAGSVVDLFGLPRINHHTRVRGDVLADACGEPLQAFFRARRQHARQIAMPLRDDALRTPEERFAGLPDHDVVSSWSMGGAVQNGWRLHFINVSANGQGVSAPAVLCLHGAGQWSYFFRHLLAEPGVNWLAPDLIGFGKSDKPKRTTTHTWEWHRDVLLEWLDDLAEGPWLLACAERALPLAEMLRTSGSPHIVDAPVIVVPDGRDGSASQAWLAPFPDRGHESALRALGEPDLQASGPTPAQAKDIASGVIRRAAGAMGYCRP